MERMTEMDRNQLIIAIATREGNARELATRFGTTVAELREFTEEHRSLIESVAESAQGSDDDSGEPTPSDLQGLWISSKTERLKRYQKVASDLYNEIKAGSRDAATLREFRFYMQAVANELGQLLHRGAGESGSDSLSVDMQGVELDNLR
jgi:hypothetical protein